MMVRTLFLGLILLPAAASADPAGLLAPVKTGEELAPGWRLAGVEATDDAIVVRLDPGSLAPVLTVRLTRRDEDSGAFCRTESFNIVYLTEGGEGARTPEDIHRAMDSLCRLVGRNDTGQTRLERFTRPSSAAPRFSWQWPEWANLLVFIALGFVFWGLIVYKPAARIVTGLSDTVERHSWYLLVIILIPMAWLRLVHLDIPFDADYMTQRLFFGSLDIGDILAHRYADQRHPQFFYLVLHFFLWFGHREWIARLPAVIFSLTTAVALFALVRPRLGGVRGLACVLLLAASASFLSHSRDVTDITLFMTLSLVSCHLLLRCLRQPARHLLVLLVLAETAMFYTYYLAVLVVFAHLAVMLLFARSRRHLSLWIALGAAGLLAIPAFYDFLKLVFADMGIREVASRFPAHLWGERSSGELLREFAGLLIPAGILGIIAPLLAVLGGVRWGWRSFRQPLFVLLAILLAVSSLVLGLAVVLVRLMPYYLLFLLPPFFLFVVVGCLGEQSGGASGRVARAVRSAGWAALCLVVFAYVSDLSWRAPAILSSEGKDHFLRVGETVRAGEDAGMVVADPDMMHTILVYYCFPQPLEMYRTCSWRDEPVQCRLGSSRFAALTAMSRMRAGWEQAAVGRLGAIGEAPFWFVYTRRFENPPLLDLLRARCSDRGEWGPLILYRCQSSTP